MKSFFVLLVCCLLLSSEVSVPDIDFEDFHSRLKESSVIVFTEKGDRVSGFIFEGSYVIAPYHIFDEGPFSVPIFAEFQRGEKKLIFPTLSDKEKDFFIARIVDEENISRHTESLFFSDFKKIYSRKKASRLKNGSYLGYGSPISKDPFGGLHLRYIKDSLFGGNQVSVMSVSDSVSYSGACGSVLVNENLSDFVIWHGKDVRNLKRKFPLNAAVLIEFLKKVKKENEKAL